MATFGERLKRAIKTSGKPRKQIAKETGIPVETISRIINGRQNPSVEILATLAGAAKVSLATLFTDATPLTLDDEQELWRIRGLIDEKLATIDAAMESNAKIEESRPAKSLREAVADETPPDNLFGDKVHLILSAIGDSMIAEGIRGGDRLYAIPPPPPAKAVGTIVVCRLRESLFVKRLVSEHGRLFLVSAHASYRAIAVDPERDAFEILGTVIGRKGAVA